MSSYKDKVTKGPINVNPHGVVVGGPFVEYTRGSAQYQIASFTIRQNDEGDVDVLAERDANTVLFAEACTVLHETGMTPRELAEQRAELLAALKKLVEVAAMHIPDEHGPNPNPAYAPVFGANAVIAKCEGSQQ